MKSAADTVKLGRAFGIVVPLFLLSLLLAGAVISIANDMYAFVKPDAPITLSISSPLSSEQLSELLQNSGVIENAFAFRVYLRSKGLDGDVPSLLGEISLNSNMSYREIASQLF